MKNSPGHSHDSVNNLNRRAILSMKEQMVADKGFGAAQKVRVHAVWEKGIVREASGKLICHPPPEIQLGDKHDGPSMNTYCPMISTGCFALLVMLQAAEKDWQFPSFSGSMTAEADLSCFYQCSDNLRNPWSKGVELVLDISGDCTEDELNALANTADDLCPASEVMKREFPVEVLPTAVVALSQKDADNTPVYYDMESYRKIAASKEEHVVAQEARMSWHCNNDEDKKHPDSLMTFDFPKDNYSQVVLGYKPPIGPSDDYANPVMGCFFGGLSAYMHTVAARLYEKGYKVRHMDGEVLTEMNIRKVMGVDPDRFVFPLGATIQIAVETNAPDSVLQEVEWEAETMSPSHANWRNAIPVGYRVQNSDFHTW